MAVLSLAVGSALTVASAWVLTLVGRVGETPSFFVIDKGDHLVMVGVYTGRGARQALQQREAETGFFVFASEEEKTVPDWYTEPAWRPDEVIRIQDARGWPMLALMSESIIRHGHWDMQLIRGIPIRRGPAPSDLPVELVGLPVVPLWGGFVLNTGVYGAAVWMLSSSVLMARRFRRRRRGWCERCGYILTPSAHPGCPECGWKRSAEEGAEPRDSHSVPVE